MASMRRRKTRFSSQQRADRQHLMLVVEHGLDDAGRRERDGQHQHIRAAAYLAVVGAVDGGHRHELQPVPQAWAFPVFLEPALLVGELGCDVE
jgi:hypothetical protein